MRLTVLIATALMASHAHADGLALLDTVAADVIASISDGDHLARTYADGLLAPAALGYEDTLTVMTCQPDGGFRIRSLEVSNSVTAAPEVLELTPNGETAFVAERLAQTPDGVTRAADLPPGNRLFAVDLTQDELRIADTVMVGDFPEAIAVSPDGDLVAIVSNSPDASLLQLVRYRDGSFGDVQTLTLEDLGITGSAEGPRGGVTVTNVQWHPSGERLAVNINTQNRVAFLNVSPDLAVMPWGEPVDVGVDPFVGRFMADGLHYVTSNWGRDFTATALEDRLPTAPSTLSVVRLGETDHRVIQSISTGVSAEGLAVSPDGALIATVNMEGSAFPPTSARHERQGSVSLFRFDPATGEAAKIGDYPFESVLPEGATSDSDGSHLLVTSYQAQEGASAGRGSGIEIFAVSADGLESRGRYALPHGAHHVDIAR